MADSVVKTESESTTLVVWKPNHGVWLLANGEVSDEDLQTCILRLEKFACFEE